jgi:15-cis-phytoene desaturase
MDTAKRVVVLGGGVAGLTVAHELVERGFEVTIYERRGAPGGKARSIPDKGTSVNQRNEMPGEHGFRFFPGFYRHVIDTMQRIPFQIHNVVADNLMTAPRCMLAQFDQPPIRTPFGFPRSWGDVKLIAGFMRRGNGVSFRENLHFLRCLAVMMTSCAERYEEEYEWIAYWKFIGAGTRSEGYQRMLGQGFTRSLVAMKAETSSTRTVATVFTQMIYPMLDPTRKVDRLLNGPTSQVWIYPWVSYLQRKGVKIVYDAAVTRLFADPATHSGSRGRLKSFFVEFAPPGGTLEPPEQGQFVPLAPVKRLEVGTDFDFVVSALPVDAMNRLLETDAGKAFTEAVPELSKLNKLETRWMNGIQIYLKQDVKMVEGHVLYVDSPWALTSISQKQFWTQYELSSCGDGTANGVLSVDISDYDTPGIVDFPEKDGPPCKKKGFDCTSEEIYEEVWAQLKRSVNTGDEILKDDNRAAYFMDDDIRPDVRDPLAKGSPYGDIMNTEPLFINTVGSLECRPESKTQLSNFFLASDYVRTYTDLATMEAANESGRRAANALLDAVGSTAPRAAVWPLDQPWYVLPWQWLDRLRFRRGKPHIWSDADMRHAPKPVSKPGQSG